MASAGELIATASLKGVSDVEKGMGQISKAFEGAEKKLAAVSRGIEDSGKKIQDAGKKVGSAGSTLTKNVTVPLLGASATVGKFAIDFEKDFSKVSTLLNGNTDMEAYKKDIVNSSKDMNVSLGDYSEAVYQAISAGVDQADAVGFVAKAQQLAEGGFTDSTTAVDVLTTALNAYDLEAEDSAKISDMLVTAQNEGKTTVDELASSMGQVIPLANANNVGMEQLSTAYAVLTKNGVATAEAGTGIKAMFGELGKSGSEADKVLKEMSGKSFGELQAEGKTVADVLGMLGENAEENGVSMSDMFGSVEAGNAAMTLAKGEGEEFGRILGEMGDSSGSTEKAYETMTDNMAYRMSNAMNKIKISATELGTALAPVIETVAELFEDLSAKVEEAVQWFTGLSDAQQKTVVKIVAFIAALGPALIIIGKVLGIVGGLVSGLGKLGGFFIASGDKASGFSKMIGLIKGAALKVAGGIKALFALIMAHPFVAIGVVVVALIILIIKNWDKVKEVTLRVWEVIKTFIKTAWESISSVVSEFLGKVKDSIQNGLNTVKEFFSNIWTSITNALKTAWETIKAVVQVGIMFIAELVKLAFNILTLPWQFLWVNFGHIIVKAWESIKGFVSAGIQTVKNVIQSVFTAVSTFVQAVWNKIQQYIITPVKQAGQVVASLVAALYERVKAIFNRIKTTAINIFNSIKTFLSGVFSRIKDIVLNAWNAVRDVTTRVITAVRERVSSIFNSIKDRINTVWERIKSIVTSAVNTVKSKVSNVFSSLKTSVSNTWNKIRDAITKPIEKARDTVKKVIDKIKGLFDFNWSLPKLKMPSLTTSGKFSLMPPSVPKFNLKWMATGGIATGASVVGVGEAGDEAIVPLSNKKRMKPFASAVSSMMAENGQTGGGDAGGTTTITGNTFHIREEADIKKVSQELRKLEEKERRAKGKGGKR